MVTSQNSKKVVVFGDLPIATKVTMFLLHHKVQVYVVIGNKLPNNNDPWENIPLLYDYCLSNDIVMLSLKDLAENFSEEFFSLGVSCRFSKILKKNIIGKFKNGILNLHGGILPEYGGMYSANHCILNDETEGGGTIHYIDENIDTGDIVKICRFRITKEDTSYTVFQKTQEALECGLEEIVLRAIESKIEGIQQSELILQGHLKRYYDKHSLDGKKLIDYSKTDCLSIERIIRAFDFPGYEPAYILDTKGNKVFLRYHY